LHSFSRDQTFHTRPIQTLATEDSGRLWFFTDIQSAKVNELSAESRASLGYADTEGQRYVAVSGVCSVHRDPHKTQELWQLAHGLALG
jgi:general stress protein 26